MPHRNFDIDIVLDSKDFEAPDMANYLAQPATVRLYRNLIPKMHRKSATDANNVSKKHSQSNSSDGDHNNDKSEHAMIEFHRSSHHTAGVEAGDGSPARNAAHGSTRRKKSAEEKAHYINKLTYEYVNRDAKTNLLR